MISRRDFLKTIGVVVASGVTGYLIGSYVPVSSVAGYISPPTSGERELRVYNWQAYLNKDMVIPYFIGLEYSRGYRVRVVYDEYNSAEEAYAKLSLGGYSYDVFNLGTEVIYKAVKNKYIIRLDLSQIPNIENLDPWVRELLKIQYPEEIDLLNYGIPYMWGTTGIVYNKKILGRDINTLHELFDSEFLKKYNKRIFMIDDPITVTMVMLIYLGKDFTDPRSYTRETLEEVYQTLKDITPYIVFLTTDQLIQELVRESMYAGVAWNGDALQALVQNTNLVYTIPEEGSDLWVDMWSIATNAKNKDLGYHWIDMTLDPWVAALNTIAIQYANPVPKSNDYIPESILENPAIYPDQESRKRLKHFRPLTEEETNNIAEIVWSRIAGSV
ncbi:MAG: extracellular solute-binding protein [Sulfolobales archaeon]